MFFALFAYLRVLRVSSYVMLDGLKTKKKNIRILNIKNLVLVWGITWIFLSIRDTTSQNHPWFCLGLNSIKRNRYWYCFKKKWIVPFHSLKILLTILTIEVFIWRWQQRFTAAHLCVHIKGEVHQFYIRFLFNSDHVSSLFPTHPLPNCT